MQATQGPLSWSISTGASGEHLITFRYGGAYYATYQLTPTGAACIDLTGNPRVLPPTRITKQIRTICDQLRSSTSG